jgi:hypothetical protein
MDAVWTGAAVEFERFRPRQASKDHHEGTKKGGDTKGTKKRSKEEFLQPRQTFRAREPNHRRS